MVRDVSTEADGSVDRGEGLSCVQCCQDLRSGVISEARMNGQELDHGHRRWDQMILDLVQSIVSGGDKGRMSEVSS